MTPDGYMEEKDWLTCQHFEAVEFLCPCCGKGHVKFKLVESLLILRHALGDKPIHVNSGFRCPPHNAEVGGDPKSQHLIGAAADIHVEGVEVEDLARAAEGVKAFCNGGIGTYPHTKKRRGWVHVDVRQGRARWAG